MDTIYIDSSVTPDRTLVDILTGATMNYRQWHSPTTNIWHDATLSHIDVSSNLMLVRRMS